MGDAAELSRRRQSGPSRPFHAGSAHSGAVIRRVVRPEARRCPAAGVAVCRADHEPARGVSAGRRPVHPAPARGQRQMTDRSSSSTGGTGFRRFDRTFRICRRTSPAAPRCIAIWVFFRAFCAGEPCSRLVRDRASTRLYRVARAVALRAGRSQSRAASMTSGSSSPAIRRSPSGSRSSRDGRRLQERRAVRLRVL